MAVLLKRFKKWLADAERGDEYVYHTGRLAEDRFDEGKDGPVENEIGLVADAVHAAFVAGEVHLFQDRGAYAGEFKYLARRA